MSSTFIFVDVDQASSIVSVRFLALCFNWAHSMFTALRFMFHIRCLIFCEHSEYVYLLRPFF